MLCIQEELAQLSEIPASPERLITELREVQLPHSNPNSGSSSDIATKCAPGMESIDSQRSNWVEGILGCMRPVWSMLSKAAINEKIKNLASKSPYSYLIYLSIFLFLKLRVGLLQNLYTYI